MLARTFACYLGGYYPRQSENILEINDNYLEEMNLDKNSNNKVSTKNEEETKMNNNNVAENTQL